MTQSPRLEEILEGSVNERLRTFFTALPGEVLSVDASSQHLNIRINVTNAIEDSKGDKVWHRPIIQNVPIQFPGGRDSANNQYRITYPISRGDQVIYLVSTLALHEYIVKGSSDLDVDPVTFNNLASGWAIPGVPLTPPTNWKQDGLVVYGNKIYLGDDSGTEPTFKAETFLNNFDVFLASLESELNSVVPGLGTTIVQSWSSNGVRTTKVEVK